MYFKLRENGNDNHQYDPSLDSNNVAFYKKIVGEKVKGDQKINNQDNPLYSRTWSGIVTGNGIPISNPFSILQNVDENSQTNKSNSTPNAAANGTRLWNVDTRMSPVSTPASSIIITAQNDVVDDNLTSNPGQWSSHEICPNSITNKKDFMFDEEEPQMDQDD